MPTRNVSLTDHFDRLIEEGVASGRYANASEMVREGLRLIEERDRLAREKLERLRAAAREGFEQIERGEAIELDSEEELIEHVRSVGKSVRDKTRRAAVAEQ